MIGLYSVLPGQEEHQSFFARLPLPSGGRGTACAAGDIETVKLKGLMLRVNDDQSSGASAAAHRTRASRAAGGIQLRLAFYSLAMKHDAAAAAAAATASGLATAGSCHAYDAGHHQKDVTGDHLDRPAAISAAGASTRAGSKSGSAAAVLQTVFKIVIIFAARASGLATYSPSCSAFSAVTSPAAST